LGLGYPYYGYPYYSSYPYDGYYDSGTTTYSAADSTSTAVQEALSEQGYYGGAIDGIVGPATTAAISAYQRDHGLPVTGSIDANLLRSLGIS
jgi:peptidoglycan hydrolase-like protein with peptidoglycan-binding domain